MYELTKILFSKNLTRKEFNQVFTKTQKVMKNLQFDFFTEKYDHAILPSQFTQPSYLGQLVFQQHLKSLDFKKNNIELWLALIDIYLKDSVPKLGLLSLRLSGVRAFLHPKEANISPFFLGGLYTFIQLYMKSLTASFLLKINLSPFCELGTTLSRSNLLVNLNQHTDLENLVAEFNSSFRMIHPSLKVEIYTTPLVIDDFTSSKFIEKTIECNGVKEDKIKDKSDFYVNPRSFSYHQIEEDILKIQRMLIAKTTKIIITPNAENTFSLLFSIGYPLETQIYFEKKNIFPVIENISLSSKNLIEIAQKYPHQEYGIARIDVSGFLKNSLTSHSPGATSLQNYRSYHQIFFQEVISKTVKKFNFKSKNKIFIMYSLLDDCTLFGPTIELKLVAEHLKKQYKNKWSGILKCGYGYIEEDTTAADLSFQALTSMRV